MIDKIKAIKTTVLGAVTIIISALVLFGVLTPDESADVTTNTISFIDAVVAAIIAASGVINIFRAD